MFCRLALGCRRITAAGTVRQVARSIAEAMQALYRPVRAQVRVAARLAVSMLYASPGEIG
ncbi:MAG: hypothetical protein U0163_04405 [Gemmatimonadaceae bacterium]